MPAARLPQEAWGELRSASEAGVPDETLSEQFQVSRESIRKRRQLEKWITPEKAHQAAAIEKVKRSSIATGSISRISQMESGAVAIVGSSLAEIGERHTHRMSKYLEDKLGKALDTDSVPLPSSWKDLNTADTMLRRSLGLDKPQTNIQLNMWGGSGSSSTTNGSSHAGNVDSPFGDDD